MRKSVIMLCILQKVFTFAPLDERNIEHTRWFTGVLDPADMV